MSVSMFTYSNRLANVKRHYNLSVDDFLVVDASAMMLARSVYHAAFITIAVNEEKFDQLKKYALRTCGIKDHIQLSDDVLCRRMAVNEGANRRWVGNCYSLTREYLTARLNAELTAGKASKTRQLEINRELNLLYTIDSDIAAVTNRSKAICRIASVGLYMNVSVDDLVVLGQTVGCLRDDTKTDNDILIIGYDALKLSKIRDKITFPEISTSWESGKEIRGYEIDPNVYVLPLPSEMYKETIESTTGYFSNGLGFIAHGFKHMKG